MKNFWRNIKAILATLWALVLVYGGIVMAKDFMQYKDTLSFAFALGSFISVVGILVSTVLYLARYKYANTTLLISLLVSFVLSAIFLSLYLG